MADKVLITEQHLTDIADAIRQKRNVSTTFYPSEMAEAIRNIQASVLTSLSVNSNGVYTPGADADGYSRVTVNVPVNVPYTVTEYSDVIVFTGSAVSSTGNEISLTT